MTGQVFGQLIITAAENKSALRFWAIIALLALSAVTLHVALGHGHGENSGSAENHDKCPLCHFAAQVLPALPIFTLILELPFLFALSSIRECTCEKETFRSHESRAPPTISF